MQIKTALLSLLIGLPVHAAVVKKAPAGPNAPKTEDQKVLYTIGLWLGQQATPFSLKPSEIRFVEAGIKDAILANKPLVDTNVYGPKLNDFARARTAEKAALEKEKAKPFLAKMAGEKGAVKTPSGLIYIETQAGTGSSPKAADKVRVHYEGRLINGTVFDSSIARGKPAEFALNSVIPCWTEGVQKMKVGGKAKLVCPAEIAYGDRGTPGIPSGATLVFQVELLDILK